MNTCVRFCAIILLPKFKSILGVGETLSFLI